MRILLDTCVWGGAKSELLALGHDVRWIGDLQEDPGDAEILTIAEAEERVLVTLDKDFGELVFLHGRSHSGILRLVEIPSKLQGTFIHQALGASGGHLEQGAIVTLKQDQLRVRLPMPPTS